MLIDQSKKNIFGNFSSYIYGSVSEKLENLIISRTVETEELKPLVQGRIKELNRLLKKIDKVEKENGQNNFI